MEKELEKLRHSASHVLAAAVKELYPNVKLGIGPAIEEGFYYDFDNLKISPEDFIKIEKKMSEIINKNLEFKKIKADVKKAKEILKDEPYKLDLLKEIKEPVFYETGKFIDLCSGPHVKSSKEIKAFKLLRIAGAYWKGDSKNKMLTRIYGTAFKSEKELKEFLRLNEEAEKRNHIKLGKQLDLFSFHKEGPGFPFWHPKGVILYNEIVNYWRKEHEKAGYKEIKTPMLLSRSLWEKSGHWNLYKDDMYTAKIDEQDFAIKPMNCPGGILIYNEKIHSYREFPLRIAELGLVHRHELSGVLNGLFRVRMFTQDDAHIYLEEEQLESEIINVLELAINILSKFGFKELIFTLSVRDEKHKEKYLGDDKLWERAEKTLEAALKNKKLKFRLDHGEAKFYGPSLDIKIKDVLNREWQCTTIQLDFNLPQRFGLSYEGRDGKKHVPIMLHRTVLGSLERFIAILIEHFSGKLPLWLAPVQVRILSLTSDNVKFANKIKEELEKNNIRVEVDDRNESIGKKVREAQLDYIPIMITVGDKEEKNKTLAVRTLDGKVKFGVKIESFIKETVNDIESKKI